MEILGVIGIPIAIVVVLILVLLTGYVKASPDEAAIISGITKKPRVLIGRAGFKLPFFERVDRMKIGQIDVDISSEEYIPTSDFINIKVDAIAQIAVNCSDTLVELPLENGKVEKIPGIELAMRNFLNKKQDVVRSTIAKSLQGNLREIIGTMSLKDICQNVRIPVYAIGGINPENEHLALNNGGYGICMMQYYMNELNI